MFMFIIFFQILGGAGLMLYGIEVMKDSLERTTEGMTQRMLEASANSTPKAVVAGIIVTMINQKSTATTVMVVALVNAGVMSLVQAAGVIMGANIGTTVTAQLLAFRLEVLAPCIVGVAALVWKYVRNKRVQNIAEIFIGCGIMFIGLLFAESGIAPLRGSETVLRILSYFAELNFFKYVGLVAVGFVITALVRSSSVLTGIMIAMASQGLLNIHIGVPLILGLNMGKCLTALWSSRGATRTAKRAAVIHLLFNTVGAVIVVLFLRTYVAELMQYLTPHSIAHQIANAHTLFNLATTIVCIPFIRFLVYASDKLVPVRKKEEILQQAKSLDVRMLETPGLALALAHNEILEMAKVTFDVYDMSVRSVRSGSDKLINRVQEEEDNILRMQKEIEVYLVKLSQKNITKAQRCSLNLMLGVTGDVECISDLSFNISALAAYKKANGIKLSDEAYDEMEALHQRIMEIGASIVDAMKKGDAEEANRVISIEISIRSMEEELRNQHIRRLSEGVCSPGSGVMFMDLIGNMERVAENIKKLGYFVIENAKY